ncbi:hypothetical protein FXN61_48480 [Lentzea sp. PSKA42]|uniref:Outer membrane channel protein CpnT-like N-terminal domain-containing protein n=1 Tax=Lentzea indica TaxID=2604800 RepID=A0ABX1G070_9PSEU|nr:hypothetical protein [Lentzea indica]NKE64111.1 hypothetical protein [Lentzea indica]
MTGDSLVAPVQSSRKPWSGASLPDSVEGLVEAIKSEGWVDDALASAQLGVETASTILDPISALLANGLGWAIEYFDPLREALDEVTGRPDVVRAHAATWNAMATELADMANDLRSGLETDLVGWDGGASDGYQRLMANNVNAIGGLSAISAAMAAATQGAGGLVEMTRELVRDLFADLVARVIVWVAESILVVTIPFIAPQIVAAVVKWAGRILTYTTGLVNSIANLTKLLNG